MDDTFTFCLCVLFKCPQINTYFIEVRKNRVIYWERLGKKKKKKLNSAFFEVTCWSCILSMSTQRKFPEKYLLSDIQGFSSLTDTLNHVTVHVSTSMSVSQNSWTDSFLANVLDLLTITPNSISFSFHSGTLCPGGLNDLSLDLSFCIVCFIASSLNSFQNNTVNKHSSKTKNIRRKQTRHLAGIESGFKTQSSKLQEQRLSTPPCCL